MNNGTYPDIKTVAPGVVLLAGYAKITGSSGAIASTFGRGFTIARTGAGTYVLTLADYVRDVNFAGVEVMLPANTTDSTHPCVARVGPISLTAKTVTFYVFKPDLSALQDPPDTSRLMFFLNLCNSIAA